MSAAAFDTLRFSETLREAGMPEVQAKALSQALQAFIAELVTRRDLQIALDELRAEFRSEMQSLRSEIQSEMQSLRSEMQSEMQSLRSGMQQLELKLTIRLGGIVVVALGAFAALSKWIG